MRKNCTTWLTAAELLHEAVHEIEDSNKKIEEALKLLEA